MDILIYSNVENLVLVESQIEITSPPNNFKRIYPGADPDKNPTGALYASKWAWSGVVVLVEVIMAMDFSYRINNV